MGSKRKHRNRNEDDYLEDSQGQMNNPFGLDMNSLMGMLGNIDKNKLNNMMNSLNQNGINMDNFNGNINNGVENNMNNQNNFGNMDPMKLLNNLMNNNINNAINNNVNNNANINNEGFSGVNNENNIKHNEKKDYNVDKDDPNIQMLLSLRKIVSKERIKFIDKAIYLYVNGAFGDLN
ncbi:hypothetical protein [Clostridium thermobutyricum]|uniref:hypothetical protein n=1 Tax=Clostridium thermobutyricum TaxID=29372 RepID=UPI0018AC593F|nr:hypothetical protein [Clostridium thermobutyricum]